MIKFHFLTGDCNYLDYGGKWISNRQNNGEFDYYFVIEILNWEESVPANEVPKDGKYNVSLSVCSPQEVGQDNLEKAFSCCGLSDKEIKLADDEVKVECLHSYGIHVPVWGENGNNSKKLLKEAKYQAMIVGTLFGFYLDKAVARIGTTGWEALQGADPREVLERVLRENPNPSPDVKLCAKIEGII